MEKIDRDVFEFQMRLCKAEIKVESLQEENQRLRSWSDSKDAHIKSLIDSETYLRDEVSSLNKYISNFIKKIGD